MADRSTQRGWKQPRNIYWFLLALLTGGVIASRRSVIWVGDLTILDQGLLAFFALLLVLPLATEFEAFGLRLKREIEDAKTALTNRFELLQATVQTSIGVRNDVNVTIPLVSPGELQRIEEAIRKERVPIPPPVSNGVENSVPNDARFLFEVRYLLERAVEEALPEMQRVPGNYRARVRSLMLEGLLSREDVQAFDQVWSIASRAIHGEPVDKSYIAFVRDTLPYLLSALKHVEKVITDDG